MYQRCDPKVNRIGKVLLTYIHTYIHTPAASPLAYIGPKNDPDLVREILRHII